MLASSTPVASKPTTTIIPQVAAVVTTKAAPTTTVVPPVVHIESEPATTPAPPPPAPTKEATTSVSGTSGGLTTDQISQFLSLHNSIRSQHDANPLTWNADMANAGQGWANKCVFQHSQGELGPWGENIAAGTGSSYDVAAAMSSWTSEISQYVPSAPVASHYTQVVWKGSQQVGCGLAPACSNLLGAGTGPAKFFVCEYSPAGNVDGEFAENVS
ncbi:hypothetical protein FRB97_000054 [Tulasnella sp. 331]|nr:hypothetical protein FRB97_000054 [Tulasnella sp. 331]KAG8890673.1 hypothetical protein FRB98_006176 [Tulasnella sp. 332]